MVLNRLEPITALMIIARIRDGKDRIISEKRIMTLSSHPSHIASQCSVKSTDDAGDRHGKASGKQGISSTVDHTAEDIAAEIIRSGTNGWQTVRSNAGSDPG